MYGLTGISSTQVEHGDDHCVPLCNLYQSFGVCVVLQSSKLQSLYSETQSLLEESDARVKQLSGELTTAQQEAEKLRKEMRTLQVRGWQETQCTSIHTTNIVLQGQSKQSINGVHLESCGVTMHTHTEGVQCVCQQEICSEQACVHLCLMHISHATTPQQRCAPLPPIPAPECLLELCPESVVHTLTATTHIVILSPAGPG
jgi:hypothetical protein